MCVDFKFIFILELKMWLIFACLLALWAKVPCSSRELLFLLIASVVANGTLGYLLYQAKVSVICSTIFGGK